MGYTLIDGFATAAKVRGEIAQETSLLKELYGKVPGIAVVLVGNDPASQIYVNSKEKAVTSAGMYSRVLRLPENTGTGELLRVISDLNADEKINGILVQLPLPGHIDENAVITAIDPAKDVDGFHPFNVGKLSMGQDTFVSCTPFGVMRLLEEYNVNPEGKHAVIVGRSNIVGKPMAMLLLSKSATITVCHSRTPDLAGVCRQADILVAAVGKPRMIGSDFVKEGAVVIDVGINRVDGKLCGDVDFERVAPKCSAITPVPKGVGPMTITMLMYNTLKAFKNTL